MAGLLRALFGKPAPVPAPTEEDWREVLEWPLFDGLTQPERAQVRALAERLLAEKTVSPVSGAEPAGRDIAAVAAQAALPVLNLGAGWYGTWNEIILYPEQFVPEREITDDFGVVHRVRQPLSGEAWEGGPLILSLDDVAEREITDDFGVVHRVRQPLSGEAWEGGPLILSLNDVAASGWRDGYNVVIHEFAHKLDMKNGAVDGLPPLHSDMDAGGWAAAFEPAFNDFRRRVDHAERVGRELDLDPYASESPAEFFAVLSEYFFELPDLLAAEYPAVYAQMRRFYRQDPLKRLEAFSHDPPTP